MVVLLCHTRWQWCAMLPHFTIVHGCTEAERLHTVLILTMIETYSTREFKYILNIFSYLYNLFIILNVIYKHMTLIQRCFMSKDQFWGGTRCLICKYQRWQKMRLAENVRVFFFFFQCSKNIECIAMCPKPWEDIVWLCSHTITKGGCCSRRLRD